MDECISFNFIGTQQVLNFFFKVARSQYNSRNRGNARITVSNENISKIILKVHKKNCYQNWKARHFCLYQFVPSFEYHHSRQQPQSGYSMVNAAYVANGLGMTLGGQQILNWEVYFITFLLNFRTGLMFQAYQQSCLENNNIANKYVHFHSLI